MLTQLCRVLRADAQDLFGRGPVWCHRIIVSAKGPHRVTCLPKAGAAPGDEVMGGTDSDEVGCEYFQTLLHSRFREAVEARVDLRDSHADSIIVLLKALYGGANTVSVRRNGNSLFAIVDLLLTCRACCRLLQVDASDALNVAVTAGRFMFPPLQQAAEASLIPVLSNGTVFEVLEAANAGLLSDQMKVACYKFVFGQVRLARLNAF